MYKKVHFSAILLTHRYYIGGRNRAVEVDCDLRPLQYAGNRITWASTFLTVMSSDSTWDISATCIGVMIDS